MTQVARSGDTVLPGETTPLSDVHWGALDEGRVLYVAATGQSDQPVLVLHDLKSGTNRTLLRGGDAIPGHPGETFQYVAHQNWLDGQSVVFRAGAVDPYRTAHTAGSRQGLYGWFNVRWDDPATLDPARLVTMADTDTPMPGAAAGAKFVDFRSAPVKDGLTAFEAVGGTHGIYLSRNGASPTVVVDNETEMPGLFDGKFRNFGIWPAAVKGGVVFTANARDFAGVFLYRADQDMLYVLADNRAPLEGKQIKAFEIGSTPMVGNRFAVTAEFKDETTGVYMATIPARAYRRIKAAVAGKVSFRARRDPEVARPTGRGWSPSGVAGGLRSWLGVGGDNLQLPGGMLVGVLGRVRSPDRVDPIDEAAARGIAFPQHEVHEGAYTVPSAGTQPILEMAIL